MSQQLTANIASHLPVIAARLPDKPAVVMPTKVHANGSASWASLSFSDLNSRSDRCAHGLERIGIRRGVKTVLMVKPSLDFFVLVFALFKVGAVLVLIDPGIGRKNLLKCIDEVQPEAFVGVPLAHVLRTLFPAPFARVGPKVTVGPRLFWGGHRLRQLEAMAPESPYPMAETQPEDSAAILFTSGSTGVPKGALYSHGIFDAQVRLLKATYDFGDDEIDLPTFPLFALFDPALGMTAVLPGMDFRKPANVDPRHLIHSIEEHGVTSMFGSPGLLDTLGRYGAAHGTKLPQLRRILSAGAPMRQDVLDRVQAMLTGDAQLFTNYGATESLPVAAIGSEELSAGASELSASGAGVCVGHDAPEMLVRVIRISDEPIERWSDELLAEPQSIGEITARGPVVTTEYYARPAQTRLAKIQDGDQIVHRMGDLGYFDEGGRLWMCGRKSQRVRAGSGDLFTVPCEGIFNRHEQVYRSALVGLGEPGEQEPVLVIELEEGVSGSEALRRDLLTLGAKHPQTAVIHRLLFYPGRLPVDIRHNAKINREQLTHWAARR